MYDPSAAEKRDVSRMIIPFDEKELLSGPLRVDRYYYFGYRQEHYGTGRNAGNVKTSAPYWRDKKPDIDNYDKFIFDVLTGAIWQDDGQVCSGMHVKVYSTSPRTEVYITQLEQMVRELPLFEMSTLKQ